MNERINKLARQFAVDFANKSGYDMREYKPFLEETEKFANLIVEDIMHELEISGYEDAFDHLNEYFGDDDDI